MLRLALDHAVAGESHGQHLEYLFEDGDHEWLWDARWERLKTNDVVLDYTGMSADMMHPDGWFLWFGTYGPRPGYADQRMA
jgi:hypothetical protein